LALQCSNETVLRNQYKKNLFILGLFNDTFNNSGYIISNDRISEHGIKNKEEGSGRDII
jgi:hypothetical protein